MPDDIIGPVELAVIEFPGSRFKGEIVPALADLVNEGIVSILDVVFVTKADDGTVVGLELADLDEEDAAAFDDLDGDINGLLSDEDLQIAGEALSPGSSAALIVWENTWARRVVGAIKDAGGRLVAHDRLDAETVQAALASSQDSHDS
jgi:uncharacterized membrane protein